MFTYDELTGELTWVVRPEYHFKTSGSHKTWNSRFSGTKAGTRAYTGYTTARTGYPMRMQVNIKGTQIPIHRIIWEMCRGPIGDGMVIDHINGNPFDNRLTNLRECTVAENGMNTGVSIANKSGFKGVFYDKKRRKYVAGISINGKSKNLGRYNSPIEAHRIYLDAAKKHYGNFLRAGQ